LDQVWSITEYILKVLLKIWLVTVAKLAQVSGKRKNDVFFGLFSHAKKEEFCSHD